MSVDTRYDEDRDTCLWYKYGGIDRDDGEPYILCKFKKRRISPEDCADCYREQHPEEVS